MASGFTPTTIPLVDPFPPLPYPVTLYEDGDAVTEAAIRPTLELLFESDSWLKGNVDQLIDPVNGRWAVLEEKLGFTVSFGDLGTLVDWGVPTFITTPATQTVYQAILDVDAGAGAQKTRLDNLTPQVIPGGDSGVVPYAPAPNIFNPGDDHHLALATLDASLTSTNTTVATNTSDISAILPKIDNLEAKLQVGAASSAGAFDWTYDYIVSAGAVDLFDVINRIDQELKGLQERVKGNWHAISTFVKGAPALTDLQRPDHILIASTCRISHEEHRAQGISGGPTKLILGNISPAWGNKLRIYWEPHIFGIQVFANAIDGGPSTTAIPWGTLVTLPVGQVGGGLYVEVVFADESQFVNSLVYLKV